MVRTSGGIRISAGKSSKKSGGGGSSGGGTSSTSGGKTNTKGSTRLPPIPHCEAPSWQKPITKFFNSDISSSKNKSVEITHNEIKLGGSSKTEENTDGSVICKAFEKRNDTTEKSNAQDENNTSNNEQPPEKKRKQEEGKDNIDKNTLT